MAYKLGGRLEQLVGSLVHFLCSWFLGRHDCREETHSDGCAIRNLKVALALDPLFVLLLTDPLHQLSHSKFCSLKVQHVMGDFTFFESYDVCVKLFGVELRMHLTEARERKQFNVDVEALQVLCSLDGHVQLLLLAWKIVISEQENPFRKKLFLDGFELLTADP